MISFPAPALCQGADEEMLLQIGETMFPARLARADGANDTGLCVWVDGAPTAPATLESATAIFRTVLGVLRAWRPIAGELREEMLVGVGQGSVRDEHGNLWVFAGGVIAHGAVGGEIEAIAEAASRGVARSEHVKNALWLNGRPNRTAADYYMIHEYAQREFGGTKGITGALGVSYREQGRLTGSANNLSPLQGGRHVPAQYAAPPAMDLAQLGEATAGLLRRWIATY